MWITNKTDYATRAVLALALAGDRAGYLSVAEIADRVDVPQGFLEQIMSQLRGAGIVRSARGRTGGYRLNHPPGEISLERIVRLFQGPLSPIACATRANPEPCTMSVGCSLQRVWAGIRDHTIEVLEQTDFGTLAAAAGGAWSPPGAAISP